MDGLRVKRDGDILSLTLAHPPANALNDRLIAALQSVLDGALADGTVRAILIRGDGRGLSAGVEVQAIGPGVASALGRLCRTLETAPKPVMALIHGTTLGAGLELALAAHYRFIAPNSRIGLPEIKLGLIPMAGGTQRLPRLVGAESALELMVSGRILSARQAVEAGIADRRALIRALDELQAAMIVVPSQVVYEPRFTYIWTLAVGRFPGLGRRVTRETALCEIARGFLASAGLTIPGELARVTGLSRFEAGMGNRALVAEGFATSPARGVYRLAAFDDDGDAPPSR